MTEQYSIKCRCRAEVFVELFEAGTTKRCPRCGDQVSVPNSRTLQQLAGDRYPLLSPLEKIRHACALGELPFDGTCHRCKQAVATTQTPCTFRVMVERQISDDGGMRPSVTGRLVLSVGSSEETWRNTTFPLLLCDRCQMDFGSARRRACLKSVLHGAMLCGLFGGFIYFAYHNAERIAAFSFVIWLCLIILLQLKFRNNKRMATFLGDWLAGIRWVPEAIANEEEYHMSVGTSVLLSCEKNSMNAADHAS